MRMDMVGGVGLSGAVEPWKVEFYEHALDAVPPAFDLAGDQFAVPGHQIRLLDRQARPAAKVTEQAAGAGNDGRSMGSPGGRIDPEPPALERAGERRRGANERRAPGCPGSPVWPRAGVAHRPLTDLAPLVRGDQFRQASGDFRGWV